MTPSDVIQLMISPAFMVSSCSILLSTSSNKSSAVIDRIRSLSETKEDSNKNKDQIKLLFKRLQLIRNALFCLELAIGLFILSSLFIGLNSFQYFVHINGIIVIIFLCGMVSVLAGIVYLWMESKTAFEIIKEVILEN